MDECPHKRPDAGREVYRTVVQHRTAPYGPHADKPIVADDLIHRGPCEKLLYKRTILGAAGVQIPVIRGEIELVFIHHRSKTHRPVAIKTPLLGPRLRVIGGYAI